MFLNQAPFTLSLVRRRRSLRWLFIYNSLLCLRCCSNAGYVRTSLPMVAMFRELCERENSIKPDVLLVMLRISV